MLVTSIFSFFLQHIPHPSSGSLKVQIVWKRVKAYLTIRKGGLMHELTLYTKIKFLTGPNSKHMQTTQ